MNTRRRISENGRVIILHLKSKTERDNIKKRKKTETEKKKKEERDRKKEEKDRKRGMEKGLIGMSSV